MSTLLLSPRTIYVAQPEPIPVAAGVLAVAIHVAFAAVLLVNMSWHHKIRPQASVKLWESLPTSTATQVRKAAPRASKPVTRAKIKPVPARRGVKDLQPVTRQVIAAAPPAQPVPIVAEMAAPPTPPIDAPQPVAPPIAKLQAPVIATAPALPTPRPDAPRPDAPRPTQPQITEPQVAPPDADITAPKRERIDKPAPALPEPVFAQPPGTDTPRAIAAQAAPKPKVDVDALRRERALALADLLREEENARLDQSLERERSARSAQLEKRVEEHERRLADELKQISEAAARRRAELEARQSQDAAAREISDDYRARISAKIRQRVILPPDLRGNPEAIYEVSLLPSGEVTTIRLLQSSGVPAYDAAVERAVMGAQPLPVPADSGLFQANFRNFLLNFRPQE